jgi:hypothetical protein
LTFGALLARDAIVRLLLAREDIDINVHDQVTSMTDRALYIYLCDILARLCENGTKKSGIITTK